MTIISVIIFYLIACKGRASSNCFFF